MEGLLVREELFEEDDFITADLAIHEVVNSIWVRRELLHSIDEGIRYITILFGLIDSSKIQVVRSGENVLREAYEIAARNSTAVYDSVFVALALQTGLRLKTLDEKQARIMLKERKD